MKSVLRGYYQPADNTLKEIWDKGLFVFDANVLLNLYRYSAATSQEFIRILGALEDCLWLPYQAAYEFLENRHGVIEKQRSAYDAKIREIEVFCDNLKKSLNEHREHPFIAESDDLILKFEEAADSITQALKQSKDDLPNFKVDKIFDEITELFAGKVGFPYSRDTFLAACKEAEQRYQENIPPGFSDNKKPGNDKYGDYIMWKQIIEHSKQTKANIIFITDDRKKDWWFERSGQKIGPRPELVQEIFNLAGVSFIMYRPERFMEWAMKYLKVGVSEKVIDEIKSHSKIDAVKSDAKTKAYNRMGHLFSSNLTNMACKEIDKELQEISLKMREQEDDMADLNERLKYFMEQEKSPENQIEMDFLLHIRNEASSEYKQLESIKKRLIEQRRAIEELQNDVNYYVMNLIRNKLDGP